MATLRILVEPVPAAPGYRAWVDGEEEKYGTTWGDTPAQAEAQMAQRVVDEEDAMILTPAELDAEHQRERQESMAELTEWIRTAGKLP